MSFRGSTMRARFDIGLRMGGKQAATTSGAADRRALRRIIVAHVAHLIEAAGSTVPGMESTLTITLTTERSEERGGRDG